MLIPSILRIPKSLQRNRPPRHGSRLNAFNCSSALVRLEMVGHIDLFVARHINAQCFKDGLDGDFLVDSVK